MSLGRFTAEGKEAWKRKMRSCFGKGEKQRSGQKGCMQAERLANFDCVLGLDQALHSTCGLRARWVGSCSALATVGCRRSPEVLAHGRPAAGHTGVSRRASAPICVARPFRRSAAA